MTDIIEDLRSFDEGAPPADGWWVAWNDLQRAADEIERLRDKIKRSNAYREAVEAYLGVDQVRRKELYEQLDAADRHGFKMKIDKTVSKSFYEMYGDAADETRSRDD